MIWEATCAAGEREESVLGRVDLLEREGEGGGGRGGFRCLPVTGSDCLAGGRSKEGEGRVSRVDGEAARCCTGTSSKPFMLRLLAACTRGTNCSSDTLT